MSHKTALLTLNGNCPDFSLMDSLRKESSFHLCTDGAYNGLKKIGIIPDAVIGDMDSINGKTEDSRIILNSDQQTNDFEKALNWLIEQKFTTVFLTGVSGGRLDHEMVNISIFTAYSDKLDLQLYDGNQLARIVNPGTHYFRGNPGQIISLLALETSENVTLTGTRYSLNDETLLPGSRGLSNRFENKRAALSFSRGKIIVITQIG